MSSSQHLRSRRASCMFSIKSVSPSVGEVTLVRAAGEVQPPGQGDPDDDLSFPRCLNDEQQVGG
jgi:hypothetical protein